MSHELLYTSAQQGLKPGSYGFCTVLATDGITKVLQERLESLSGYEHAFALTDHRAPLNPVNYSHLIVTVANQRVHLLSRIADAGADYSGRSNKLAHHVALQPGEVTAAGPAWTLATPGFCKSAFDGTPRSLPAGPLPSPVPRPFTACAAWERVCKDARWAGVLAELTLKNPTRPITLIYAPGTEVLPLVVEAMSLLPPDRQWRTTFSTFFTKLPAGIECQWRFVLDGTSAADAARRNLQSPPINLASPGPLPFEGPLIDAARSGRLPHAATPAAISSPGSAPRAAIAAAAAPTATQTPGASAEDSAATYRVGAMPTKYRASDFSRPADENPFDNQRSSRRKLITAIVGGVAVFGIAVGVGIYFVSSSRTSLPAPPVAENGNLPDSKPPEVEKPNLLVKHEASQAAPKTETVTNTKSVAVATTTPKEAAPPVIKPEEIKLPPAFDNIAAKGRILTLPRLDGGLQSASGNEPHELCKVFVKSPSDCELKLFTTETFSGEPRLILTPDPTPDAGTRSWTVMSRTKKDVLGESQSKAIGRFVLHGDKQGHALTFAWDNDAPEWSNPTGLMYCKLDVQVGSEKVACNLSKPSIKPVEKIDLTTPRRSLAIGIPARSLASTEFLRFDLELHLGDWSEGAYLVNVNTGTPTKLVIPRESRNGDGNVELEFRFTPPNDVKSAELSYMAFVYLTGLVEVPGKVQWKREAKRADQIDKAFKDGLVNRSFQDVQKNGAKQRLTAQLKIPEFQRLIEGAERRLNDAVTDRKKAAEAKFVDAVKVAGHEREISDWKAKLADLEGLKQHWQYALKFSDEVAAWILEMKDQFVEIEQKLEIRYSVYLDYGDERVVLAETDPPPKRPELKAPKKVVPPANPGPDQKTGEQLKSPQVEVKVNF